MSIKIIDVERKFTDLFDTIPQYEIEPDIAPGKQSDKLFFGFGEQKELNTVLITKQRNGQKAYPLLWLKMPYRIQGNNARVSGDYEFILASNTEIEWRNDTRFNQTFRHILYPNFSLVMQALRGSNGIHMNKISGDKYYEMVKYPNYGSLTNFEGKDQNKQIDYWDALSFKVNLTINNNCIGVTENIYYDTNNLL